MLSYQHAYHAGNFADIHKHLVLTRLLEALHRKDKPFCYLETHAGRGYYDLRAAEALKTGEAAEGIGRIWGTEVPDLARPLLARIGQLNGAAEAGKGGPLTCYPGSPLIARGWIRALDRMQLMELHPQEFQELKALFRNDAQASLHQRDGFEGVLALSPPAEKRGLVLVDPSYELKTDYQRIPQWLAKLARRWSTGIFAIWYPLLPAARHRQLLAGLEGSGLRRILVSELSVRGGQDEGMYGSGMAIVHAPWQLDLELEQLMPWLCASLAQDRDARQRVWWLVDE